MVLGGFAVDEESRATRSGRGGFCSGAVAFFADDEEQAEIARACGEQSFGGRDHGRDAAFGVAGSAAPNIFAVGVGSEERWDGVHVRRKRDDGFTPGGENIVAITLRQ